MWAKVRALFVEPDPPLVRLANAILVYGMRDHATVVYVDRDAGVRGKVRGELRTMMPPLGKLHDPAIARLQEMAGTDQRAGTIRLDVGGKGPALIELRPYGRDGVVLTIEENPYPVPDEDGSNRG